MTSLSDDLRHLALELLKISQATKVEDDKDYETVYGYYYSKGALDYRDKLLEALGALPKDRSAVDSYHVLLGTYPDTYPGPTT